MKGCFLNRKPYTDKHGKFRCRVTCCEKPGDQCTGKLNSPGFEMDEVQRMAKMRINAKHGKKATANV